VICKKTQKLADFHIGTPVAEHRLDSFSGNFERERKCISGFIFLGPEYIKS